MSFDDVRPVLSALTGAVALEEPEPEATVDTALAMWAVVLAGGIGSRFWPLSTPERPKQVLSLVSDRPLIAETVARLGPLVPPERVLVLTSRDIAPAIHGAIPEVPEGNLLVEPRPLGTAAALAWGAHEVARRGGPDAVLCAIHADLAVGFPGEFRSIVRHAAASAGREAVLVPLGAPPTRAETDFGYIVPGAALPGEPPARAGGSCRAARFVEKPMAEEAAALLADGALWNAGVYLWRARVVLDALAAHVPEVATGLDLLAAGALDDFAARVQSVSIERGLLARTDRLVVTPAECMWDDVGTWACLRRTRELDDDGNGASGRAYFVDATSNVVHSERGPVVLYGVSQLLVVAIDGVTFVTTLDRARDLKPLLDALPPELRTVPGGGTPPHG